MSRSGQVELSAYLRNAVERWATAVLCPALTAEEGGPVIATAKTDGVG